MSCKDCLTVVDKHTVFHKYTNIQVTTITQKVANLIYLQHTSNQHQKTKMLCCTDSTCYTLIRLFSTLWYTHLNNLAPSTSCPCRGCSPGWVASSSWRPPSSQTLACLASAWIWLLMSKAASWAPVSVKQVRAVVTEWLFQIFVIVIVNRMNKQTKNLFF